MNAIIEAFLERPLSQRIAIWVLSLAFFGYIFWAYFYSAKLDELRALEEKKEELVTQISHERRLVMNLGKVRDEVKQLDMKLAGVLRELPDKREIPDLLASISGLARRAGLEIALFKPNPENFRDFYAEVPVAISVTGLFHQVATFFDEVGRLSRIVNIGEITVRDPKLSDLEMVIKADCVATTFRYLDESERAPIDEDDADQEVGGPPPPGPGGKARRRGGKEA